MGFGGAVVATAGVILGIETDQFHKGLHTAESELTSSVSHMGGQLTKLEMAENDVRNAQVKLNEAVIKFSPNSNEARSAANRLTTANQRLAKETEEASLKTRLFGGHSKDATRELGALTRGGIAGSGMFHGLGRSIAFTSGAFLGGVGLLAVLKQSVSGASNLVEQTDKVNRVFQSSAGIVKAWSEGTSNRLGIASEAALEFAGTFGAILVPMGQTQKASAVMSTRLVSLSADLASFYNRNPEDALKALQSGIVGMSRPLRQFGILLTASRVNAEAVSSGIVKTAVDMGALTRAQASAQIAHLKLNEAQHKYTAGSTQVTAAQIAYGNAEARVTKLIAGKVPKLTDAQKVQARYSLILKDSALANGDFERTGDKLANQQRKLSANIKEVEVEIGTALMPTVLGLVKHLNTWITHGLKTGEIQREINSAVHTGTTVVTALGGAFKVLWSIAKPLVGVLGGVHDALIVFASAAVALKISKMANLTGTFKAELAKVGPTAVAAEGETVTAMTGIGVAARTTSLVIKSALISTGIGLVVVAFGLAVGYILTHLEQVKGWFISFGHFLKQHMVLLTVLFAPFLLIPALVIRNWGTVKSFFSGLAKFFSTVFVHPIRAIKDAFDGLWSGMKRAAIQAALAIIEPFSHLPGRMGGWARKMKKELQGNLDSMTQDAAKAGKDIGTKLGQNMFDAFKPYASNLQNQLSSMDPGSTGKPGQATHLPAGILSPIPAGDQGAIVGHPDEGTHHQKDWQSRNAIDIKVKPHTPILAPEAGRITKVSHNPPGVTTTSTGKKLAGSSVTLEGGFNTYFFTHLLDVSVKSGQHVKRGQVIGHAGALDHVHFAIEHGNPESFINAPHGKIGGATTNDTTTTDTTNDPIDTATHIDTTKKKGKKVTFNLGIPAGLTEEQSKIALLIYHTAIRLGASPRAALAMVAGAWLESKLNPSSVGGGLFQIQKNNGNYKRYMQLLAQGYDPATAATMAMLHDYVTSAAAHPGASLDAIAAGAEHPAVPYAKNRSAADLAIARGFKLTGGSSSSSKSGGGTSLLPQRLIAAEATAKTTKGYADDVKALEAEEAYLQSVIKHAAKGNARYKAVIELAKVRTKLISARNKLEIANIDAAVKASSDKIAAASRGGSATRDVKDAAGKVTSKEFVGEDSVVFDEKSQTYIVTKLKPDVDALKAELKHLLTEVLPKLRTELNTTNAAIKRLSKHPKKNKASLANLRKKAARIKGEITKFVALANDLATSIDELDAAISLDPEPEQGGGGGSGSTNEKDVRDGSSAQETAENAAGAIVSEDEHLERLDSLAFQSLSLKQQLAGTENTPEAAQARADFINQRTLPDLKKTLGALQGELTVANQFHDKELADTLAEAIASKQNEIDQAMLDALHEIASSTGSTADGIQAYLSGVRDLTRGYASNVLGAAFAGQLGAAPLTIGPSGTMIQVQNYFGAAPTDPHLFTQSLGFELQALLA
jgi:murein DD-endopeptidase MepM/ murein hydrolase activator NlpD